MDVYISATTSGAFRIFGITLLFPYIVGSETQMYPIFNWLNMMPTEMRLRYISPDKLWIPKTHEVGCLMHVLMFYPDYDTAKHIFPFCKTVKQIRATGWPRKRIIVTSERGEYSQAYSYDEEFLKKVGFEKLFKQMILAKPETPDSRDFVTEKS